jgi:hypothetical protein
MPIRVHPLAPVVALDIDGSLADYYAHFKWFAELYLQEELTIDWSNTTEFSEALGLEKDVYRSIKLAYRQGGMKRSIPVLNGDETRRLIPAIRRLGVQAWICTTRPWQRLDNIDPDTQWWLNRNFGRVDGVIYGEEKYEDLIDIVGRRRILGVFDDLPENIVTAGLLGLNTAIRRGDHNERWIGELREDSVVKVVNHNSYLYALVQEWLEENKNPNANRGVSK